MKLLFIATLVSVLAGTVHSAENSVREAGKPNDFPLALRGQVAALACPPEDFPIVAPATQEDWEVNIHLLPAHPISGSDIRLGISFDAGPVQAVTMSFDDGGPTWAHGALNADRIATTKFTRCRLRHS